MTDKTDPRLDVATPVAAWFPTYREEEWARSDTPAQRLLADLDAAARKAGYVPMLDTNDEALRDRLVAVIEASECVEKPEHDNTDGWGLCAICEANAILAALREAS